MPWDMSNQSKHSLDEPYLLLLQDIHFLPIFILGNAGPAPHLLLDGTISDKLALGKLEPVKRVGPDNSPDWSKKENAVGRSWRLPASVGPTPVARGPRLARTRSRVGDP